MFACACGFKSLYSFILSYFLLKWLLGCSWLWEKHQRPAMVECLFWQRAEFRVHYTVNNPCFIPNTRNAEVTLGGGGSIGGGGQAVKMNHFPQEVVKTANEALAKMLSIEKCDTVVMNPLFGSGLPYKPKVIRWGKVHSLY